VPDFGSDFTTNFLRLFYGHIVAVILKDLRLNVRFGRRDFNAETQRCRGAEVQRCRGIRVNLKER
jgi:hypothetical protein